MGTGILWRPDEAVAPDAFEIRLKNAWSGDALFRVYVADGRLYFIRIGKRTSSQHLAIHFGLIGMLVTYFGNKRAKKELSQMRQHVETKLPAELMSLHKQNFFVEFEGVDQIEILPRSWTTPAAAVSNCESDPGKNGPRFLKQPRIWSWRSDSSPQH